jgi:hypothetical protein
MSDDVVRISKGRLWTGRVISFLPAAMLLFSASMKFSTSPEVQKGFEHLGWPRQFAIRLAIVEIACAVLYLIPQTAVLGAILVTGYLGGAAATHARLGEPDLAMPVLLGVLAWLGLLLRDRRLQSLLPLRKLPG